jgi:tRNA(Ile)-lysidine synthase
VYFAIIIFFEGLFFTNDFSLQILTPYCSMNLYEQFYNNWKNKAPFNSINSYGIVAVSGGLDSIVLCHLLHHLKWPFAMAHCNFNLRGDESERDQKFVENLANKLNVTCYLKSFNTQKEAEISKESIQVTARNLRYNWFAQLQNKIVTEKKIKNVFILTAHHANDNVETVLHHLIRGTGLNGLTGIEPIDYARNIIRPLLNFTKQEILLFAQKENIEFVEDSSNESTKYTRNFLRKTVIPLIEEKFPNWQQNMQQNILRLHDAAYLYYKALQQELKGFVTYKNNVLHLPINKLKKSPIVNTILWEVLMPFGLQSAQISEIIKLLDATNAAYIKLVKVKIIRDRAWLVIVPNEEEQFASILIERFAENVAFANSTLHFEMFNSIEETNLKKATLSEIFIPAKLLCFPMVLRPFKTGDYFYPLGMQKKKKLSRFFIDLKLSPSQKEQVWVLESNKKIIWVIGLRLDDRFKLINLKEPCVKISIT